MKPLILNIPAVAVSGSSGKTTTREMIASILGQKMKVLKNKGNKNLPHQIKELLKDLNSSYGAVVLELGLGKPGAGEKDCSIIQPNYSIITNIGTAHFGNLGNSIESIAKFKSVLIKKMKPDGVLILNNDDENSRLLETADFRGQLLTVGIQNTADYQASQIKNKGDGMSFHAALDNVDEEFFVPALGMHSVINALFAVALCHHLKFTPAEIRSGLEKYQVPEKRLNRWELVNNSLLLDDSVNANPQSVKAAVDVLAHLGQGRKKIAVLGSMLELGEHTVQGHQEVGRYLAEKEIDQIITFGKDAKSIKTGAIEAGYPAEQVKHFYYRENLHQELKQCIAENSVILVKGSSMTQMDKTAEFIRTRYNCIVSLTGNAEEKCVCLNAETLARIGSPRTVTLHFGASVNNLQINLDDNLETGKIVIPQLLSGRLSIPNLPYEYYVQGSHIFLGPVIGILVLRRYFTDPQKQILRFAQFNKIKGLVYLFRPGTIHQESRTITGYFYNPETNSFVLGELPYPNAIFNRIPLGQKLFRHLKRYLGEKIFNYPYFNVNKWSFWVWMSKTPEIKKHLPETRRYSGINSLVEFLDKYNSTYLKPTTMAGGHGILRVERNSKGYLIIDRSGKKMSRRTVEGLTKALQKNFTPNRRYIMQREISTLTNNGNKIDFRVYFQKNHTKRWTFSGIETKVANAGSIISNSENRERIVPGLEALKEFYNLDEQAAGEKLLEIRRICFRTLRRLERSWGHMGDAAVDLVIDRNLKVWLLEVQLNYAAELKATRAEDEQQVLPQILPTPLEYAKALAGF